MKFIPFQKEFEPLFPPINGNKDYREFKEISHRIDYMLENGGIEQKAVELKFREENREMSVKESMNFRDRVVRAFRCNMVLHITGLDFRGLSIRLADSLLFQKFCNLLRVDEVRVPGKSTLEVYSKMFAENAYREIMISLINNAKEVSEDGKQVFNLQEPVNLDDYFADSTCVEANIHVPVDWVLLRDACRTLYKATSLIRKENLKNRMKPPEEFMKKMNRLCIEMTHSRRKKGAGKHRKTVFRKMRKLVKTVANHAKTHRELLDKDWESTDLSRKQAEQIIKRIDGVLELLPKAITQAHERIIGERGVKSEDKLLSLYETEINLIVRGKAGAEVEYGNTLMIAEQSNGLVIDWRFVKGQSPGDPTLIQNILKRSYENYEMYPNNLAGDRGLDSKKIREFLEEHQVFNGICPKSVPDMKLKLEDDRFVKLQTRRSQTEGRRGILKNGFFGKPMRSKGFGNRQVGIASAIFTRDIWVLARLPVAELTEDEFAEAA